MMLNTLVFVLTFACCLRLVLYRRGDARFKRGVSVLAWLFIVFSGGTAMYIVTGRLDANELPRLSIALLVIVTVLIFISRGNVAKLLTINLNYQRQSHDSPTTLVREPKR